MNINNFDLNLLRAFDALMLERNVSKAADRMSLSQPAMSNTLNRLRKLLDDPVLVRTSKGMQPTPKATKLEHPIRSALTAIEHSLAPIPDFDPLTDARTFHIATTDYVQLLLLQPLIEHVNAVAPNIKIEIHELSPDIPVSQLEDGTYDFAIGRFNSLPSQLRGNLWHTDELVCVVSALSKDYGDTIELDQFLSCRQVWVSGGQHSGMVDQWLAQNDLARNVSLSSPNFLMAPILISQSDYLLVTPKSIAHMYATKLPLKILSLPMKLDTFNLHIIWHPYHASTQAHAWLKQQIEDLDIGHNRERTFAVADTL
ncbi:LysR family transcriptional regulator [Oceaniserpentilla sp. 4NH20-0058]|uniref:LysR family transcriptional regulator n=1 Tax=Oceaniserpentilla sp. 4NH20-0058 TaxID=3127660 RepID=UPI0031058BF7